MIRRIVGLLLVLTSAIVIWLFPALETPRHSRPFEGQDLMQFHEAEMAKVEQSHGITLWVCVTAGAVLGIGLSLFVAGLLEQRRRVRPCVERLRRRSYWSVRRTG